MSVDTPTLSVIVANYNSEKYIRDCLESILTQTYKDLEVLVCDDCSSDHSLSILKEYEKQYPLAIRVISNSSNCGVTITRHLAILQARGQYLTTLDSDDYYINPQKLQREMELVFSHKKNSGKDIIAFSNIVLVKGDKTLVVTIGNSDSIKEGQIIDEIISRSCMIPRDFIMTRDVYFDVGGFDTSIPIYEDWDLKIRLASKCEFYYSRVNGTAYRRHGEGLSAAPISEHIKWTQTIFDKNLSLIHNNNLDSVERQFNQFVLKLKEKS